MWDNSSINIGRVKEKTTKTVLFKYTGVVPKDFEIDSIEVSCGCMTPTFDFNTGYLTVIYNVGAVPKHLRYKNEYTSTKKIILKTSEGQFTLKYKATIYIK